MVVVVSRLPPDLFVVPEEIFTLPRYPDGVFRRFMTELRNLCPRCDKPCKSIGVSASRGSVYRCDDCSLSKMPLLWHWESSRLWEGLDEPEGVNKPTLVTVILASPKCINDFV